MGAKANRASNRYPEWADMGSLAHMRKLTCSLAHMRKLVAKLRFAQGAVMGRSGRIVALFISCEWARKLTASNRYLEWADMGSLALMRKLAAKLRFALGAGMGGFGRAALKTFYKFLAGNGGQLAYKGRCSLSRWAEALPKLVP